MPNYDFTRPIDLNSLPASVVLANAQDPARQIEGAPPIFGQEIVPHFYTSTGYVGSAARAYPIDDEATRNSVENAERMRTESAIMECLEARMRATALLKYHVVPENEKSPKEIKLAQLLTKLLERIPYFTKYRYALMEALWYGKAANVNTFGTEQVGDQYRTVISDWSPRHGDKLMFRYADGTYKYKPGQLGIRVHSAFFANMPPKLANLPYDQLRMKVEATQYGLVYWFDDYERDTIVVHKHIVEDGPWHEPRMMGRVMGIGIRDRIYWTWYGMNALLADLMTFVSRAALGVRIWRYPSGNKNWKEAVENAAKNAIHNGMADILFPVEPNEYAGMYGVEQIEPGISGAQMIRELIEGYFLKKIKKYILGQLLTTEAESTGMGGGVAAAHIQTFSDIVRFDAVNLSETLTRELLRKLQYENARDSMGVFPRLILQTDEPDVQKRLAALSSAYQMDVSIKTSDVYELTGISPPEPGDEVITVSTQQLRQQKAMLVMQGEEQMKQMRMQQQMQQEAMQQQAAMQQQMGGAPGGAPQPGQEQGQPPAQELQPQDKAALDQTPLDVSPQGTDRDNGPVMSGELAKNATGEASYEIQRQATNPWDGFWESFFNAARGGSPEVQNDPLPEAPDAPVDEAPVAEVQLDPLPTPKVQNDPLVTTLSEIMDQYVQKQRTIQEWTQDLDRALRRQSLAKGFDPSGERQDLVRQLGDALDHEMLASQLTDMLDVRSSSYAADEAVDLGAEPDRYPEQDQYAALSWNPVMHPRGNAANPGQFTKKIGVDPDMASTPEPGGSGMESDDPQQMPVAPPLPPARSAVARVDLPDEINNKVQELAAHIPDYLLDGEGRTEDAHITIKMLADDDPRQIAPLLQDEAPFRAVLGQVTVVDATESRPFDVVAIKVHSSALHRLHRKLSQALDGMQAHNGYSPYLRVADVQPGTADKWIGWAGLEGESVVVDSLTFVNRNHEPHKIPLQGQKGEYQLDRPEQYAAKQLSMFDAPVQAQPRVAAVPPQKSSTPLLDISSSSGASSGNRPLYEPPVSKPLAQSRAGASPLGTISVPRSKDVERALPAEAPKPKSLFSDEEMHEARRISPRSQIMPSFTESANEPDDESDTGSVPGADEPAGQSGGLGSGVPDGGSDSGRSWVAPSVRTARPEYIRPADTSIVPEVLQRHLTYEDAGTIDPATGSPMRMDYQLQRTAKAFTAMKTHGGFIDASGPGTGKSRVQLAAAKMWADQGMKAIIVTRKQVIGANWDMFTYGGSFQKDGKVMDADLPGTLPKLLDGQRVIPEAGNSYITTYDKLPSLLQHIDNDTVLLFDESHSAKNEDRLRSMMVDEAGQKAHSVMYSTATPADKPLHIAHMFRAKVFGNRPPEDTYKELGLKESRHIDSETGHQWSEWKIDPKIGGIEVHRRLNGLFNRMTKEGLMVKHEIDLTGTEAHFKTVTLPDYAYDELANLEDNLSGGAGIKNMVGGAKGRALLAMRRHQETYKIPAIIEHVQKELAEDPNRQVVIFADRINESEVKGQSGEMVHYSQGTIKLLADAISHAGISDIAHLHGGSTIPHRDTIKGFQEGKNQVMLATLGTGGTGVDLPDLRGDRPRTVIMMTGPLAADQNVQAVSRTIRLSSKSNSRLAWFFSNAPIDDWGRKLLAGKMSTLGAVVKGEVEKLQLPFDIGSEGMEDLIASNRDQIAQSQLDEPYEWRQLTDLPQVQREEDLQKPLFEDMELGRRKRGGSEAHRPPPKGYKRRSYTQDGTPERYSESDSLADPAIEQAIIDGADNQWSPDTIASVAQGLGVNQDYLSYRIRERYAAKYGFEDLHPRAEDNKRFVDKHKSVTLAQTLRHPATSGERSHYKKYADFVKVGGTKPLPFKAWLQFHRTAKFHKAQKEREDAAKTSPGGRDSEGPGKDDATSTRPDQDVGEGRREGPRDPSQVGSGGETEQLTRAETSNAASNESETVDQDQDTDEDQEQEGSEDAAEFTPERPSRSVGNPSKHSLNAIRSFATALYTSYYQDQNE